MPHFSNVCLYNVFLVAFLRYLSHLYTLCCITLLSILLFDEENFAKAPLTDLLLHDIPLLVKVVRGERFHPGFVLRACFCTKLWSWWYRDSDNFHALSLSVLHTLQFRFFADTYLGGMGLSYELIRLQGAISRTLSCKAEYYLARQQSTTNLRSSR